MDFDWDEANEWHLGEHDIEPYEATEVLFNDPVKLWKGIEEGELRYRVVGETDNGRLLVIVYTYRGEKVRVITGFKPNQEERRKYKGRRGK